MAIPQARRAQDKAFYPRRGEIYLVASSRLLEVSTGVDRRLGSGYLAQLAHDGRSFSYLFHDDHKPDYSLQLGNALSGSTKEILHTNPEPILDHAISGDGLTVFAVLYRGEVVSIDVTSGEVTEILGAAPPRTGFVLPPAQGSYNELVNSDLSVPEAKESLARLPPRWLRVALGRSFGKRRGTTVARPFQPLDLLPQLRVLPSAYFFVSRVCTRR